MLTQKQKIKLVELAKNKGINVAAKRYYSYYYKPHKSKAKYSKIASCFRSRIREWINIYNLGNMNQLICKTGKAKGKGQGRPKKPMPIREVWDMLTEEERFLIFEDKLKEDREKLKKERMKKQDKFESKLSQVKRSNIWFLSREGIRQFNLRGKSYNKNDKSKNLRDSISKIAFNHAEIVDGFPNYRKGRKYIANELKTLYSIDLSPRYIGMIMTRMGVSGNVRRPKRFSRVREAKNTKIDIPNHLEQNYDRDMTITADVKYIEHVHSEGNHAFLEPIIHIKSGLILAWDLAYHQGTDQILRNLKNVDLTKIDMFGSDHGSQYVSKSVQKYLKENGVVQSCSRVAVSLDNRPSEHWFGILQTECLNFYDLSKYTFEEIKKIIGDFIIYYNTKRKQEKLGWLTPEEYLRRNPGLYANF